MNVDLTAGSTSDLTAPPAGSALPAAAGALRVLLVLTGLEVGGAERQVVDVAVGLRRLGFEVMVATLLSGGPLLPVLKAAGIDVRSLGLRRGVPDVTAVWRFRRLVRDFAPDAVHSHMVHANVFTRIARGLSDVPVLVTTSHSIREGGRVLALLNRLTHRFADAVTAVSSAAVDAYAAATATPPHEVLCTPNGIDTLRFERSVEARHALRATLSEDDPFVWLAVGRFAPAKDYPTLLQAFAACVAENPNQLLLIAGQGELFDEVVAMAGDLGLSETVRFLGLRADVTNLMSAADGFVLSSLWEGLPMVLLEAMSCELPVVATDVGGNGELVAHGGNGFLCQPGRPDLLAEAMGAMVRLPAATRAEYGRASRSRVEADYSLERVVENWGGLYRRLSQERAIRRSVAG